MVRAQLALKMAESDMQVIGDLCIFKNERIGGGAFGTVFKGTYKGKPCALKVLHHVATEIQTGLPTAGGGQDEAKKAFERECDFLRVIKHSNVVICLAIQKHPSSGQLILISELMDGNLRDYLKNLPEGNLRIEISICKDIATALEYIHARQIVHRDLCGDNVLLKQRSRVNVPIAKIGDFGMSRVIDASTMSTTLTALGHREGYMPPEAPRIDDESYDSSLDIFSFGVIMMQIVRRLETVKNISDRRSNMEKIPDQHLLKQLILNCLQDDMKRRPSATQLTESISRYRYLPTITTLKPLYNKPPPAFHSPSKHGQHVEHSSKKQPTASSVPQSESVTTYASSWRHSNIDGKKSSEDDSELQLQAVQKYVPPSDRIARANGLHNIDVLCPQHLLPEIGVIVQKSWKAIGRKLGLSPHEINTIRSKTNFIDKRATKMLEKWYSKKTFNRHVHIRVLIKACLDVLDVQHTEKVCKLLAK